MIPTTIISLCIQDGEDSVTTIAFSDNGYHLATGHATAKVRFWDLRKQEIIATMNDDGSLLQSISSVIYDASGKYAAFGGRGGLVVTTVKDWGTTMRIELEYPLSGIGWTKRGIATCSEGEQVISYYSSS